MSPAIAALAEQLALGVEAFALSLDHARQQKLLDYLGLVQKWNRVYNLTAITQPQAMLEQHIFDSLGVVRPLQRQLTQQGLSVQANAISAQHINPPQCVSILDVGSGAGLPGVVLAICEPQWRVTCVDAVGKKAAFIQQVAGELHLPNLVSTHARVEGLDTAQKFDVITARAFSSLSGLVGLTRALLASPGGVWLAMKARTVAAELAQLPSGVEAFHVERVQEVGPARERNLVWMRPCLA